MKDIHPDDFLAVRWFNSSVRGQPVILEANGDSYTDYGRISMATGLPTVLGWFVHEWLWRADRAIVNKRAEDVAVVYESDDLEATNAVLRKYGVRYIVVGTLERNKFKKLQREKLMRLGPVVFDSLKTKVIEYDPSAECHGSALTTTRRKGQ